MHAATRELGTLFTEGAVGMLSDGQLLDRFVDRRDASAFEAIVERYGPLVWGVCRRVVRDHHDAEDAFQATFLVLARKAASVMPREKLGNWLYGVAFQTAMKARATRAKRRVRERPAREMIEPEAVANGHPDELLAQLDREVTRLPEKYRLPVILCELEGKTHRQAAEQLGWPVGTVSGRLSRARALLASRLSRRAAPLSVGALEVLFAHDVARAGAPPELVHSTAQAASLSTVGKAVTAGVVSARVAALTGEVMKTMLLNKLKLTTAMLLAIFFLAAGGASLTYRAHANEPANQKKDSEKPRDQSSPAEAVRAEVPPPGDQPKPAVAPKEEIQQHEDTERVASEETKHATLKVEGWQGSHQRTVECGAYSFTALRTGKAALAYNAATREVKALRLNATKDQPLWVTPVVIESSKDQVVALGVRGEKITRVGLFSLKSGRWLPLNLDQPVSGGVWPMSFGPDTVAYEVGDVLYVFNPTTDAWDRLDLRTIADDTQDLPAKKVR
jgi:RNA polymerase sigma factor (sigma-70 family)